MSDKHKTTTECKNCDILKQLIKDTDKNRYALYHRDYCICHGTPRDDYEFLLELLERIKKIV